MKDSKNIIEDSFDNIFDNTENSNLDELPFESMISNDDIPQKEEIIEVIDDENIKKLKLDTVVNNRGTMIVDDRIKDIPVKNDNELELDNGILIFDDKIKNIKPNTKKNSSFFKHPTIIFPVIAFVFVSILGMYLFVTNSMADTINLIKVENNNKIGYIDSDGTIITKTKYIYGTDYYKGYAIVKNNNNLYGVLNSKGVLEVAFGNYYYIGLFGDRYIASKITNSGLKQALLDSKLSSVTSFKYDNISFVSDGIYLFVRDETIGVLNEEGKEIYKFEVDEVDDKNIDIEISKTNKEKPLNETYAKVKVNNSSTIINVGTGVEVFSYTLSDINVLDNNVFYIKSDDSNENSTYIVISNNDVKLKTTKYKRVRVDDIDSNIAIGINNDTSLDYINLDNQKVINDNSNNDYYYSDGVVLEKTHNFSSNKDVYNIISAKKVVGTFTDYIPVDNKYYNDYLMVRLYENKYNFLNKEGVLLNNKDYDIIENFNENGYAIVSNENYYGVVNTSGKEIIPLSYNYIEQLDDDIFNLLKESYDKELFIYKDNNDKYGIVNKNNKIEVTSIYDKIEYISDKYPIVLTSYLNENLLLNLSTGKELSIKIKNNDIDIRDNYIIIGDEYYNYSGKLIYTVK